MLLAMKGSPRVLWHSVFSMNLQILSFSEWFQPGRCGELGRSLAWKIFVVQVTQNSSEIFCKSRGEGWKTTIQENNKKNNSLLFPPGREAAAGTSFPRQREGKMNEWGEEKEQEMSSHPHSWEPSKRQEELWGFLHSFKNSHSFQHLWLGQDRLSFSWEREMKEFLSWETWPNHLCA